MTGLDRLREALEAEQKLQPGTIARANTDIEIERLRQLLDHAQVSISDLDRALLASQDEVARLLAENKRLTAINAEDRAARLSEVLRLRLALASIATFPLASSDPFPAHEMQQIARSALDA